MNKKKWGASALAGLAILGAAQVYADEIDGKGPRLKDVAIRYEDDTVAVGQGSDQDGDLKRLTTALRLENDVFVGLGIEAFTPSMADVWRDKPGRWQKGTVDTSTLFVTLGKEFNDVGGIDRVQAGLTVGLQNGFVSDFTESVNLAFHRRFMGLNGNRVSPRTTDGVTPVTALTVRLDDSYTLLGSDDGLRLGLDAAGIATLGNQRTAALGYLGLSVGTQGATGKPEITGPGTLPEGQNDAVGFTVTAGVKGELVARDTRFIDGTLNTAQFSATAGLTATFRHFTLNGGIDLALNNENSGTDIPREPIFRLGLKAPLPAW